MRFWLILWVVMLGAFSEAKIVRLGLSQGQNFDQYNERVASIEMGDDIEFSDGKIYRVVQRLDLGSHEGQTSRILEVTSDKFDASSVVLRIPQSAYLLEHLEFTEMGYPQLVREGVSIPQRRGGLAKEYILQEKVVFDFTFNDLYGSESKVHFATVKKATAAFNNFARSLAGLSSIGDFAPRQLVYDSIADRWFLLDWSRVDPIPQKSTSNPSPLDSFFGTRQDLEAQGVLSGSAPNMIKAAQRIVFEERQHRYRENPSQIVRDSGEFRCSKAMKKVDREYGEKPRRFEKDGFR